MKNAIIWTLSIIIVFLLTIIIVILVKHSLLGLIKEILIIVQSIVIIIATIFTVNWTYKTFGYKERIDTLSRIKSYIMDYYSLLQIYYAEVRKRNHVTESEIKERVDILNYHNNVIKLIDISLWIDCQIRKDLKEKIREWLTKDRMDKMIQYLNKINNKERKEEWENFEKEYKAIIRIIENEAVKYR